MKNSLAVVAVMVVLFQTPALSQESPFAAAPPENPFAAAQVDRYVGVFQSEAIKLELQEVREGYEGSLYYAATDETYSVTATLNEGKVDGAFNAGGTNFPFTFLLNDEGTSGAFETEGYSGSLTPSGSDATNAANGASPSVVSKSDSLFREALAAADRVPAATKPGAIFMVALYMIEAGDMDGARALEKTFSPEEVYGPFVLGNMASTIAGNGDIDGGYAAVSDVAAEGPRSTAMVQIIGHQAKAGDVDGALAVARGLPTVEGTINALVAVANVQGTGGLPLLEEAEDLVKSIAVKETRDVPRLSIARSYAAVGEIEKARDVVDDMHSEYYKTLSLSWIAQEQAKAGDIAGAKKTIERAAKRSRKIEDALLPLGVIEVAAAKAVAGDLAEALIWMRTIDNPVQRSAGYMRIINWKFSLGDFGGAQTITPFVHPSHTDQVKSSHARALADAGDFDGAEAMARSVSDPMHQATAFASVAASMATE